MIYLGCYKYGEAENKAKNEKMESNLNSPRWQVVEYRGEGIYWVKGSVHVLFRNLH